MPFLGAERAKAFRHCQRAKWESACQPRISDVTTAADSLMELHIKMWSADTDMAVDKQMGLVGGSNSGHPRYNPLSVNYGNRNGLPVTHFDHVFLSNDFGEECRSTILI
jgi:hypothetical protein